MAAIAFVAISVLMAWPEPPAKLLVASDAWEVEGGFVALDAPVKDLRASAVADPQMRYWRSWNPQSGSQPGRVRTKPFTPRGRIVVPYNGFSGDPGIGSYLECVATGRRVYLATSRNNTQWSETFPDPPSDFCAGSVRVVAESKSTQSYIAIGTPYEIGWLSSFKQSTLASAWFLTVAWAVLAGWFLFFARIASGARSNSAPLVAGLIGLGLIGYLQFFVFWFFPTGGKIVALILVALGILWTGVGAFRGIGASGTAAVNLRSALGTWLLVAMGYLMLSLIGDDGAGAWAINGRFSPARWSTDNQLPAFVARILVSGNHIDLSDFSQWTIADRPPLAYGWHATTHAVLSPLLNAFGDAGPVFYLQQLTTGVILNSSWVLVLGLLLPLAGLSRIKILLLTTVLALSAFFIFNSLFIWPKLLSATFTFTAAWILLGLAPNASRLRTDDRGLIAAAILCALGLLTHGGSVFGIVAAICLAAVYRGMPSITGALIAAATAVALLLPWSLWQSNIQPPGNALIKFAFAGTFGFGEEKIGALDTILRSYHDLSFDAWLEKKRDGLLTLLFGLRNSCGVSEMGASYSFIDRWRGSDFYNVVPSLNFLLFGAPALLLRPRKTDGATLGIASRLMVFALASIALSLLATWDCYINHHQSYQALVALHLGLALALIRLGRWGMIPLALNIAYALVVWILEPLGHFPRFDYIAAGLLFVCALLWAHMLRTAYASKPESLL